MTEIARAYLEVIGSYLFAPIPVTSSHIDRHLADVRNLLTLESIEICLNR